MQTGMPAAETLQADSVSLFSRIGEQLSQGAESDPL